MYIGLYFFPVKTFIGHIHNTVIHHIIFTMYISFLAISASRLNDTYLIKTKMLDIYQSLETITITTPLVRSNKNSHCFLPPRCTGDASSNGKILQTGKLGRNILVSHISRALRRKQQRKFENTLQLWLVAYVGSNASR